jgi:preprotein translocase subunit SecD
VSGLPPIVKRKKSLKNFSWKQVLVFVVIVTAIIYILPSWKPALWPHKQINLGLDLQGGMHLVLEVDTEKAIEGTVERISQEMRELLKKKRIRHVAIERVEGNKISAEVKKEESIENSGPFLTTNSEICVSFPIKRPAVSKPS